LIVDTSALVAVLLAERGAAALADAVKAESYLIPAPVLVEFERVLMRQSPPVRNAGHAMIEGLIADAAEVAHFNAAMAAIAVAANVQYGSGNGTGGPLNMLDLMVYGIAKTLDLPILCTGRDFSATDARIHPASRID
jgi:ribonuclease VapC